MRVSAGLHRPVMFGLVHNSEGLWENRCYGALEADMVPPSLCIRTPTHTRTHRELVRVGDISAYDI